MSDTATTTGADARAKIKERLRKLLAMTTDNGATEAEALAAAKMAADLMAEHDLTYETADEVKAERYGARTRHMNATPKARKDHEVAMVCNAVGRLFQCQVWRTAQRGKPVMRVFFGTEADTAAAHDMTDMLCVTMEAEFARYHRSPTRMDHFLKPREVRLSFMSGMANRLNERLNEIHRARKAATQAAAQSNGRALVLVTKEQTGLAKYREYLAAKGMSMGRARRARPVQGGAAYAAGQAAGARVDLGGSARIGGGTTMIGR